MKLSSQLHLVPRLRTSRAISKLSLYAFMAQKGKKFPFFFICIFKISSNYCYSYIQHLSPTSDCISQMSVNLTCPFALTTPIPSSESSAAIQSVIRPVQGFYPRVQLQVKVKFSLEQAMKAQRGSRCIALLFLQPRR